MSKPIIRVLAITATLTATATHAQYRATRDVVSDDGAYDRPGLVGPVSFDVGAALSMPVSDSGSRFDPGTGFTAGVTFRPPRSAVGVEAEYMFTHYDVEGDLLEGTSLDGSQVMHHGVLNVVVRPPNQRRFGFYLLGGGGVYYRNVEVAEFAGVGIAPFCDPYLFACYPQAVPVSQVVGSEDSVDFGVNGGFGVYAVLTAPMRLYLEARYHYMWGPEFDGPAGNRVDSDGQYVPVVLGLAF